jgi:hypothetical protein
MKSNYRIFLAVILISFIFEWVRLQVVEETRIVIALSTSATSVGKACVKIYNSWYKSIIVAKDSFCNLGFTSQPIIHKIKHHQQNLFQREQFVLQQMLIMVWAESNDRKTHTRTIVLTIGYSSGSCVFCIQSVLDVLWILCKSNRFL